MKRPPPIPPPPRPSNPSPDQLLGAAVAVLNNNEPILSGRRSVTAAALARQAVETAVESWLVGRGASGQSRRGRKEDFLCLGALHPDPDLAHQLHNVWARLSEACHATSYDLPPTSDELQRWLTIVQRFIRYDDQAASSS